MPVIFGVLTTIAAFLPLLMSSSGFAAFSQVIGGTVVFCLIASLLESQLFCRVILLIAERGLFW